jgi:hypothetical protein
MARVPSKREEYARLIARKLELASIKFEKKFKRGNLIKRCASILELSFAAIAIFSNVNVVIDKLGTTLTSIIE